MGCASTYNNFENESKLLNVEQRDQKSGSRSTLKAIQAFFSIQRGIHLYKRRFIISVLLNVVFIITIILILVIVSGQRTEKLSVDPCPESWVRHKGRCFFFSDIEGTWDFAQRNCLSYGASLTAIDTQWEMEFLMNLKGHSDRWIGLYREDQEKPWKWTNGSLFNNWFNITADGLCVYLGDGASSTWNDTQRHWICRK